MRWERYQQSREKEDLDKSIVHYTTAIFLLGANDLPRLLFHLTIALQARSENCEQPEGIEYSITYLRYLRRFPIDSFNIPRSDVTESLICALGTQVELGAGSETGNIKEMVVLARELLSFNLSTREIFPIAAFMSLAKVADAECSHGGSIELLDEVIECLRGAVKACPPGPDNMNALVSFKLAEQLFTRFVTTHSLDDYEEATALLEKMLDPNQPGSCPDSICGVASILATRLAVTRDTFFTNPEYSEVAISHLRASANPGCYGALQGRYPTLRDATRRYRALQGSTAVTKVC